MVSIFKFLKNKFFVYIPYWAFVLNCKQNQTALVSIFDKTKHKQKVTPTCVTKPKLLIENYVYKQKSINKKPEGCCINKSKQLSA